MDDDEIEIPSAIYRVSKPTPPVKEVKIVAPVVEEPADPDEPISREEAYAHRKNLIAHMAASGATHKMIADKCHISMTRVSQIVKRPEVQQKIMRIQDTHWGKDARKRIESLAKKALDNIEALMDDPMAKCSTKLAASTYIVDQAIGRAKQSVNVESNTLGELLNKIDQLATTRAVAPLNELEAPIDSMDTFIDEFIPNAVVIGKRDLSEESEKGSILDGAEQAPEQSFDVESI